MTYLLKRYINRVLYINYIALAIVPSWELPIEDWGGAHLAQRGHGEPHEMSR